MAAIGAGLAAIAHRKLSAERLAEAIETAVDDSDLRRRPAGIGEARRAEDGVADAVDLIEAAARSPGANAA